ncbi:hypothetical protein ACLD5S_01830 [Gardnerella vaginalis]|uniref:hypothetical protein n=1 Tax=Gardnerella vaginalis TaxID=2702 RepID=UPI00397093F7
MMNKKAIAAFAAGATLLAGFAMATPAMAEETPVLYVSVAKANTAAAYEAYTKADAVLKGMTVSAAPAKDSEAEYYTVTVLATGLLQNNADASEVSHELYEKVQNYVTAYNNHVTSKKAFDEQTQKVNGLLAAYLAAVAAEKNAVPDPVEPTLAEKQKKAIAKVYTAKQKVDQAEQDVAHTREAFVNASKKLKAAKAQLEDANKQLDAAKAALDDFVESGVKDEAKRERLETVLKRAEANVKRVEETVLKIKTMPEYRDAKAANDAAQAAYEAAVEAYKTAYNEAVALDVNPDLLPHIVTMDPLSATFPELAEAQKIYDDALAGKFGADVQKSAQKADAKAKAEAGKNAPAAGAQGAAGAAAGKAGASAAKGELSTKGGNGHGGKAGEKLGNAGVGVALTALAASMLAGMGAAVRKMRH